MTRSEDDFFGFKALICILDTIFIDIYCAYIFSDEIVAVYSFFAARSFPK